MSSVSPRTVLQLRTLRESFAALFEESLTRKEMRTGEVITAEVVRVDVQLRRRQRGPEVRKHSSRWKNSRNDRRRGRDQGRRFRQRRDRGARGRLRRDAPVARQGQAPGRLAGSGEGAREPARRSKGMITGKVKGGLTVMANGIRAFLPGSLVDLRPVKDTTPYEGKEMEFKVIKLDRKRNNVVVSRRAVLEKTRGRRARGAARQRCRKAPRSRASSRTSPTTARSSTWAASTACCTSPTSPGGASSIPPRCCQRRRRGHRQGAQVRHREEPRVAGPEAARRGSLGRHRRGATRRARACSARSPTSPTTARSSRSSRASRAWCTSRRWTGPTRTCIRRRWCRSATRSR